MKDAIADLREFMREAALEWRRTPKRQRGQRARLLSRAVFFRNSIRTYKDKYEP